MGLVLCCMYYSCCCCICCPLENEQQQQQRQPTYNTQVARRTQQREPLLIGHRVEEAIVDGVLVRKDITSVAGLTQSGKVQIAEKQQIIATDGTNAIVGETTRVYKANV